MRITARCTSVKITPSDASGFFIDIEVADRTEIIRQSIHEMTEAEIDNAFGKENADRAADAARRAIDRGLKQAALESRLATLESENAKLKAEAAIESMQIANLTSEQGRSWETIVRLTEENKKLRADAAKLKAERDHWKAIADEGRKAGREEAAVEAVARYVEDDRGLKELAKTIRERFGGKA